MFTYEDAYRFQVESNQIEEKMGLFEKEAEALWQLMGKQFLTIEDLMSPILIKYPHALLREDTWMKKVYDTQHPPLLSGRRVREELDTILVLANWRYVSAHEIYIRYMSLLPFTHGNGVSGRMLWLWLRKGDEGRGFLNEFHANSFQKSLLKKVLEGNYEL